MRIAFYAPLKPPDHPVPSGDRQVARLLLAALRRAGHEVSLASRLRSLRPARRPAPAAHRRARAGGPPSGWCGAGGDGTARRSLWFTYHLYYKAPDYLGPAVCDALGIPYVVAEASFAGEARGRPLGAGPPRGRARACAAPTR